MTTGGDGAMVTRTCAEALALFESVTDAVRTWLPSESVTVRGPVPSAPSRSEVQRTCPARLVSKSSVTVAVSAVGVPAGTEVPSAGDVIVICGG